MIFEIKAEEAQITNLDEAIISTYMLLDGKTAYKISKLVLEAYQNEFTVEELNFTLSKLLECKILSLVKRKFYLHPDFNNFLALEEKIEDGFIEKYCPDYQYKHLIYGNF